MLDEMDEVLWKSGHSKWNVIAIDFYDATSSSILVDQISPSTARSSHLSQIIHEELPTNSQRLRVEGNLALSVIYANAFFVLRVEKN